MEEGLDLQDMQAHTGYAGVCLLLNYWHCWSICTLDMLVCACNSDH
jgi:hypothetical protein